VANAIRAGEAMDSYFVCYDISNPKRLRKVARTCEDFGYRKQFSVFLCRVSATDFVRLRSRLYDIINLDEDQILFIPLCAKCIAQIEAIGRPTEAADTKDVVVVV
jgi:CRISPR-associated protein Cas2